MHLASATGEVDLSGDARRQPDLDGAGSEGQIHVAMHGPELSRPRAGTDLHVAMDDISVEVAAAEPGVQGATHFPQMDAATTGIKLHGAG